MLLINQRLDKLAAARTHYAARGMIPPERIRLLAPVQPPATVTDPESVGEGQREEEEGGATDERVLADVKLARTPGVCHKTMSPFLPLTFAPLTPPWCS